MRIRARSVVARRLGQLEAAFGGEPKCRCGLDVGAGPLARAIVTKSPDDFPADYVFPNMDRRMFGRVVYEPCQDCGLQQLIHVTYW